MSDLQKHTTPEGEHLAEQERLLAELTEQLATKETEFATTGAEFARFRVHYLRRFAPLYAELDRLKADSARRVAVDEDTPDAHAKAAEAAGQAEQSGAAEAEAAQHAGPVDEERTTPSLELRDLYRDAAKRIHPDLATDDAERIRRTALMAALNTAYAAGDADAIRRILDGEAARPEAIIGDDVASRLVRVIRRLAQIRGRFSELVELSEARGADPLFALFSQCRAAWEAGDDPLAEDEASLRTQIASAQARLAALVRADVGRQGATDP